MDKLQICVMGMANTSAPPFINLPDTLSIPAALLMRMFLKDLGWHLLELLGMLVYYDLS